MRIFKNIFKFNRNYTISNQNIPKCKDCKNYVKHVENDKEYEGLGKCRINGYNLQSGPVYFYTSSCRNSEIYCGKNGKFFNKK